MGREQEYLELEAYNPEAEYERPVLVPAPRLSDLNHKKIGLFWNGKLNGDRLLDAVGRLLRAKFTGLEVSRYNLNINAGDANLKRMAQECDGVVAATGD
ncbi:MAG: hypothetical protein ABID87_09790 [Chloroflexota bacterium]